MAAAKTSYLNLWASDNLSNRELRIAAADAGVTSTYTSKITIDSPIIELTGQTTSANDVADLGAAVAGKAPLASPAFSGNPSVSQTDATEQVTISHGGTTGTFQVGETVTGGTSAATGVVVTDDGSSTLTLRSVSGTFQSGEVATGGTSGATCTLSSAPSQGSNLIATTRYVHAQIADAGSAPIESPSFTGTPTAPTAATDTSTTQIATTAFVDAEIANDAFLLATGGTAGASATLDMSSATSVSVPTKASGDNTTAAASTAFVQTELSDYYSLSSGGTATGGAMNLEACTSVTVPTSADTVANTTSKNAATVEWVIAAYESRLAALEAQLADLTSAA